MMREYQHPFDEETILHARDMVTVVPEIHRALEVIDQEMDFLRRDMDQLANARKGNTELVKVTDETNIYRTTGTKWADVVDALRGPMYTDEEFSGRVGVVSQRVHYRYADYKTGGFGGGNAIVLSKQPDED